MPLIDVNGVELHYHLQGKGIPIVFIHPACIGSRIFTYMRNDLSLEYKTLLFDCRGHGRSSSSQVPLTIPLLAEDVVRILDKLAIPKAIVCGYSLGTMVAMQSLLTYSDRIVGAILLAGVAQVRGWKTKAKIKIGTWASKRNIRDLISIPLAWAHADNHESFRRIRSETIAGDMNNWREFMNCGLNYSLKDRLKEIEQPVLLLCGGRDKEYLGYMRELQQGLLNHSSAVIAGGSHSMPIYGASQIGELIRNWMNTQQFKEIADQISPAEALTINPIDFGEVSLGNQELEGNEPYYH